MVLFSSNVTERYRTDLSSKLGVRYFNDPERYLGSPNMIGHNKKLAFQSLKDRLKQKIDSWSTRFLSQGGRKSCQISSSSDTYVCYVVFSTA